MAKVSGNTGSHIQDKFVIGIPRHYCRKLIHLLDISIVFTYFRLWIYKWLLLKWCCRCSITVCCVITECNQTQQSDNYYIHSGNINDFAGCTIIKGIVRLLAFTRWAVMTRLCFHCTSCSVKWIQEFHVLLNRRDGLHSNNLEGSTEVIKDNRAV